jgi:hypothetical protein
MSFREGHRVAYVGDGEHGLVPGDRGKVLSAEDGAAHVLWMSGVAQGQTIFHDNYDLVSHEVEAFDTDFYGSPLVTTSVRETYDREGPEGLLNALNEEGHMSVLSPIAEDALGLVANKIKHEPAFIEVLGELDELEADHLVSLAAFALLRDAFGEDDE